jgi:hypothetical protein
LTFSLTTPSNVWMWVWHAAHMEEKWNACRISVGKLLACHS